MSKGAVIWLIIAASLVVVGGLVFVVVMTMLDWDFKELATNKYEDSSYEINEEFRDIFLDTDTVEIRFVPSDDGKCSVECYEQQNMKHSVEVKDGVLVIERKDTRKWYEHIGINFESQKITVYLPREEYGSLVVKSDTGNVEIPAEFSFESMDITESTGSVKSFASVKGDVKITTSTGDVCLKNISAGSLKITVSTGKITASEVRCEGDVEVIVSTGDATLQDVLCKNVISGGNTGHISLNNVIASQKITIERSTGDVKFDGSDAAEISIKTDTGDVEGSLLTDKVFITKTDTGRVRVPDSISGGRCEITTDTGDVKISIGQ